MCGHVIAGKLLKFVTYHRDLGVLIDSKLRFHNHVRSVFRRAEGLASEMLRSTTICRSSIFMLSLFVSHIRLIMDFCSNVWNVGYLGNIKELESVQRRLTREIADVSLLAHVKRLKTFILSTAVLYFW